MRTAFFTPSDIALHVSLLVFFTMYRSQLLLPARDTSIWLVRPEALAGDRCCCSAEWGLLGLAFIAITSLICVRPPTNKLLALVLLRRSGIGMEVSALRLITDPAARLRHLSLSTTLDWLLNKL